MVYDNSTFINYLVSTSLNNILLLSALHILYLIIFLGGLVWIILWFCTLLSIGFFLTQVAFLFMFGLSCFHFYFPLCLVIKLILIHSEKNLMKFEVLFWHKWSISPTATVLYVSVQKIIIHAHKYISKSFPK